MAGFRLKKVKRRIYKDSLIMLSSQFSAHWWNKIKVQSNGNWKAWRCKKNSRMFHAIQSVQMTLREREQDLQFQIPRSDKIKNVLDDGLIIHFVLYLKILFSSEFVFDMRSKEGVNSIVIRLLIIFVMKLWYNHIYNFIT